MPPALSDVTLIDGRRVRSDSEEWRAECEARALLRLPSRLARTSWLRRVEERRGRESGDRLRKDAMRLWEHYKRTVH